MAYIIGIILVIIVLLIIGLILRKRIYDLVDKYENWKLDIMGRNVASQLSRIKTLNLSGETQERFEMWKGRWEDIITKELPDIEEHLFDAEEAADRFLISKAKKILKEVETILQSIEKDIEQILAGLDELLDSEETSRKEVEELEPGIKSLRKQISQNRYQYGKAELYFEEEIDKLEDALKSYHELVGAGNYIEAKEVVLGIKYDREIVEEQLNTFPSIYKKCRHDLPVVLDNLLSGIKEMKEEGYRVEHLAFEKEINSYQNQLVELTKLLDKGEMETAEKSLSDMEERINEMYQLLEKEAIAKNYLDSKLPVFTESISSISNKYNVMKEEVEALKKAYFFEDSDMEKYLSLGKTISSLQEQLEEILEENKEVGHSELRESMETNFQKLEELTEDLEEFKERIHSLRKDELEAREQLDHMRKRLYHINRKLKKSNIPGVPTFIWNSIDQTTEKNNQVITALEGKPLDMSLVQKALTEANYALEQTVEQTDIMLDQAYLTEQVIQYANRYRSKYPLLAAKLIEAERLFRNYEYELALETAAKAIEEVEPGALKNIEEAQTTNIVGQ
ncbi:septation ring formation regulator EzrA [Oceanobacillus piezotolerans]|uniref:Septation ring formation regulator EzrA n=1 Tax=Oceanobacillus piezotolerans TaxID=2448030 RepID=A0A498D9Q7_9BACI|nr:septation ring formation regulator EzrA [Oceanobacillus piezotolerans]RLL47844.1 septation ring formation regulator EzrA [Oceanobacillus piezotolerans]